VDFHVTGVQTCALPLFEGVGLMADAVHAADPVVAVPPHQYHALLPQGLGAGCVGALLLRSVLEHAAAASHLHAISPLSALARARSEDTRAGGESGRWGA